MQVVIVLSTGVKSPNLLHELKDAFFTPVDMDTVKTSYLVEELTITIIVMSFNISYILTYSKNYPYPFNVPNSSHSSNTKTVNKYS